MIRGCSKRVIVLKHPQGDVFEEAYFIVKEGRYRSKKDTSFLISEAEKIIGEKKKGRLSQRFINVFFFLLGMAVTFIIFCI